GNFSFGDYFKEDAIRFAWELMVDVYGLDPERLWFSVFEGDDKVPADEEAAALWVKAGAPPERVLRFGKKDNFWQMGDTGPCGPCSEIHFNLLPSDDEVEGRKGVNSSSPRCIEIWNHVFIQFNANADGTFAPLAAKHVDTGMGFERVAGIYATTKGFKDFSAEPSNYNADVFAPLFAKVTALSGKTYRGTVPTKREGLTEQENIDIAFRVLADHARCVSCAIADGIMPGNDGRNYVIRRILRRGILYGKKLGFKVGDFSQLVAPVVESLGHVFPELKQQQEVIRRVIQSEEESFGRTLDRGLGRFWQWVREESKSHDTNSGVIHLSSRLPGSVAFELYDTYGFPLDMTQLLASEQGLKVNIDEFEQLMEQQRERARAAQKKEIIVAATEGEATDTKPTAFLGYTTLTATGTLLEVVKTEKDTFLVFDQTPFYGEMGGQAGDTGTATIAGQTFQIVDCVKDKSGRHLHKLGSFGELALPAVGSPATLAVDAVRRRAINRHHSSAHLIHWALRKVLGTHVRQAGTSKTPERMRFDFSHFEAMTPEQIKEVERLVNEKVIDNAKVESYETEFDKKPEGTLAFFGDKYGKFVRVVDIGGYSRELCGGTHVATTGEIGLIKIVAEMAVAAGTRRVEAVAGQPAFDYVATHEAALKTVSLKLNAGVQDVAQKLDALLAHQKELERKLKIFEAKAAAGLADELIAKASEKDGLKFVTAVVNADSPDALRSLGSQVLNKLGEGVVTLGAAFSDKASVVAFCSPAAIKAGHQAGKIVGELCAKLGGKGGGKPDFAMGGGKEPAKLAEVLK
ncbi:MAG: alanine--tRNA ligase, partial [Candidatus Didemnitutus sp.]|nr:alanine--tRNA ligase [Candidatus Didemnitutus sp.]